MPVSAVNNKYFSTGDIFVREAYGVSPAFFTDTITITNVGKLPVLWPPGTPLGSTNLLQANTLVSVQKLVYMGVTLQPGEQNKVCIIDAKALAPSGGAPGNLTGFRINLSKLPLIVFDRDAPNTKRTYTYAAWAAVFGPTRLNVPTFDESTRFDPSQT